MRGAHEMKRCITIGRQFGSGGRELGWRVAQKLGIPFYDKELIDLAAGRGGLSPSFLEAYEERVRVSQYVDFHANFGAFPQTISDTVFIEQVKVIRALEGEGPCVIVGRCADYVLGKKAISVFVYADLDARVKRKAALQEVEIPEEKLARQIRTVDRRRAYYYNHYTDKKWGAASSYDLCVDTSEIGVEGASEVVMAYLRAAKEI